MTQKIPVETDQFKIFKLVWMRLKGTILMTFYTTSLTISTVLFIVFSKPMEVNSFADIMEHYIKEKVFDNNSQLLFLSNIFNQF